MRYIVKKYRASYLPGISHHCGLLNGPDRILHSGRASNEEEDDSQRTSRLGEEWLGTVM